MRLDKVERVWGDMGEGPRDWSPPGYWDDPQHPSASVAGSTKTAGPRERSDSRLKGLLAVLFGLASCFLPLGLPAEGSGYRGWVATSIGITAVGWAIWVARARRARNQSAGILAVTGGVLGVAGSILCLWSILAFYSPSTFPPAPRLLALTGQDQTVTSPGPGVIGPAVPSASGRVVAPIQGADVTAPTQQLRANLRHVAILLCGGLSASKQIARQYPGTLGGVPSSLTVGPDRVITGGNATYSTLPIDMTLEYTATPEGSYSLTVRDALSGIGVGCDSTRNVLIEH
jgi:hypothetical protein